MSSSQPVQPESLQKIGSFRLGDVDAFYDVTDSDSEQEEYHPALSRPSSAQDLQSTEGAGLEPGEVRSMPLPAGMPALMGPGLQQTAPPHRSSATLHLAFHAFASVAQLNPREMPHALLLPSASAAVHAWVGGCWQQVLGASMHTPRRCHAAMHARAQRRGNVSLHAPARIPLTPWCHVCCTGAGAAASGGGAAGGGGGARGPLKHGLGAGAPLPSGKVGRGSTGQVGAAACCCMGGMGLAQT